MPKYPGRVTLTPVAGQENTFDMAMADEPTIDGTPLNKATLLQDATASALGLTSSAVPNDAFGILASAKDDVANLKTNIVKKLEIETIQYTGTGATTKTINFYKIRPYIAVIAPSGDDTTVAWVARNAKGYSTTTMNDSNYGTATFANASITLEGEYKATNAMNASGIVYNCYAYGTPLT